MIVMGGSLVDERVHHARPSIDVLFESAALAYADRGNAEWSVQCNPINE